MRLSLFARIEHVNDNSKKHSKMLVKIYSTQTAQTYAEDKLWKNVVYEIRLHFTPSFATYCTPYAIIIIIIIIVVVVCCLLLLLLLPKRRSITRLSMCVCLSRNYSSETDVTS